MTRLFLFDLKKGIFRRRKLFLPVLVMPFLFGAALVSTKERLCFLDGVLHLFRGMPVFQPSPDREFSVPFAWLLFQLYLLFLTAAYPISDLNKEGVQVLSRSGKRGFFWLSKCAWNAATVLLSYLLYWLGIGVTVLLGGGVLLGLPDVEVTLQISGLMIEGVPTARLLVSAFLLPLLSSMALSALQQAASLWLREVPSFVIAVAVLISSAFWTTPLLIGNHSMLFRTLWSDWLLLAVLVDVAIMAVCAAVGVAKCKRYDILG